MNATASTTASDGTTVQDCVTFYVDGVASPSPLDPTTKLESLYSTGTTPHLMTGLATHESGYNQFLLPGQGSPNEPDLYDGIQGLWPREPNDGGSHIGLMMVPTTDADAWDWTQNATDGVTNIFVGEKLPLAQSFENWLDGKAKDRNVPYHEGLQPFSLPTMLENMALVLYRGNSASAGWAGQYYIPECLPPDTISAKGNTWTCKDSNGNNVQWTWEPNDPDPSDANAVQAQYISPPGISGSFGNKSGLQYVNNDSNYPWYDQNIQKGVRQQMK